MTEIVAVGDHDLRQTLKQKEVSDYVGPLLARIYPGYRWRVEVTDGIVDIRCEMTDSRYGYTLKPELYFSETQWRAAIIKAGGEILERSHLSRRGFDAAALLARSRDGLIRPDL